MKFFIDSADVSEIKRAAEIGIIDGVTTNPSLIAKSGRSFEEVVKEITTIVDGPISAEVTAMDHAGMMEEAKPLIAIHENITIKVPMTEAGITTCVALSKQGVKVNVTLIFHLNQAIIAAKAGAAFVSPFAGRLDDIGEDGLQMIAETSAVFAQYGFDTEILAASIRNSLHVKQAALAGADVVTMPGEVFHKLFKHHLTDQGIEKFLEDWKSVPKSK
ncbi:MAG: fructose-6-phosphate aldolase [Candidatus Kerfeldbacteria bacterium CG15_BIG_FIL_POST_REV_8_21_14_020_45_12]|uniref:Probable transaldolase n=1 Tax=Candidatus Kerfeldbacteria bacterium CG15_BIG_FIL_POST_REV_8_21_14_020_45_12 TaxID=2014247 RepID=A0A2M7H457_9BACT|nr:MAG: fructose-6-phosphate aldolase [Candidatus Kerfeldbacteria bacterium CG15_BIG_FIL_POST_REV_8_21_14_020_45_12]PJA93663.1 MAG: fructose-6-phosphate aldolase [Candidatus Kerfeldbacteria bacterium CG_4_9_14_3_um_filter_45_8]